jgi:acetyltransferase-like isoleucine patch superfamily enzyme
MKLNLKEIVIKILLMSPFKSIYEEKLVKHINLLFVNWIFQRILGINGDVPWSVHFTSKVTNPEKIILGKGVKKSFAVSSCCYIQGGNGVEIREGTIFAPGIKIISANHGVEKDNREWIQQSPIIIGKDCWIGTNAVILPGVVLGDNVIVGAGAVVTHSFPDNTIIAGVPAKIIRHFGNKLEHINISQ